MASLETGSLEVNWDALVLGLELRLLRRGRLIESYPSRVVGCTVCQDEAL